MGYGFQGFCFRQLDQLAIYAFVRVSMTSAFDERIDRGTPPFRYALFLILTVRFCT
jgi:hypothetical protein